MALKENLKHFKDFDDYGGSLTKKDLDDDLDLLADNIDLKADETIVGIVTDGTTLKQRNSESRMAIGNNCTVSGDYGFAYGDNCTVDGYYSLAYGNRCIARNSFSFAYGYSFVNKQGNSKSFGVKSFNAIKQNLKHYNCLRTTNDTQTDFYEPIALWTKSINYIIIKCEAIKDDYTTKWIFERKLIVRVDADGNVTIDSDNNTDIVKDDADWAFDITSTNDSTNPTLTLKVTGKADTTIAWGIEVENRQTYFAGFAD